MRIMINVSEDRDVTEYVEYVAAQIEDGYTSGHVDRETHWEMET